MKSEPNELPSPLEEILKEKYFQANTDAEVKEAANGLIGFVQLLFKADREIKAKEAAEAERHAKKTAKNENSEP